MIFKNSMNARKTYVSNASAFYLRASVSPEFRAIALNFALFSVNSAQRNSDCKILEKKNYVRI